MRKLMWFTIGFAVPCGLCSYAVLQNNWILPCAVTFLCLFLLGLVVFKEKNKLRFLTIISLGISIGFIWFLGFQAWYLSPLDNLVELDSQLVFTASDYGVDTEYGTHVDGLMIQNGKPYQVRIYLKDHHEVLPGSTLSGRFSVQYAKHDAALYFNSKGIYLFAYQKSDIKILEPENLPLWCYPAVLRHRIQSLLNICFPEDVSAFAKALLLGDSKDLDYATDTAFKISGIRHIIAVSGLHISILYSLISLITMRRRFLTAAVGLPVLLLFAAVTGFTPSVLRASLMVGLMMLSLVFDREYDSPTALAFSILAMLIANPMAITSVSLQMSVACVAGILLFQSPIYCWMETHIHKYAAFPKLHTTVCSSISVTLSTMTFVTPLSAFYFGTVSLVSVATNLLTLWIVNILFYGLILVCVLWWIFPWAASLLASVLSWPMRYVLASAKLLSSVPLAAVYTQSLYIVLWMGFVYILLVLFLLQKKKQPGMLFCCSILSLCLALIVSWAEPSMDAVRITMLDVGQGQSILLQSEGTAFLVDCGGDDDAETADKISETLLSQGISRLDGIILTHYDRDHSGALHNLLTRICTDRLILPDTRNTFLLPKTDAEILWIWEDVQLTFGSSRMVIYGPVYSGMDNENSLCILFDTEKCDILITGDRTDFGERMLMRQSDLPDVDILVAGHHGAADSTSEELLHAVSPETILISVKENNYYGHPSDKLLQRLEAFRCDVYRTDLHGTITIRR